MADPETRLSVVPGDKVTLRRRMRAMRLVADQKQGPDAALALMRNGTEPLASRLAPGAVVAGFWPIITEIDLRPLLARLVERGFRCALPAIVAGSDVLVFRAWRTADPLEEAPLDTRQPLAAAATLDPDLLLVPLLAVDARGNRLGQGKGWYDRTLRALRQRRPVTAIGVGYAVQVIEEVPVQAGDEPMDGILTEEGLTMVRR